LDAVRGPLALLANGARPTLFLVVVAAVGVSSVLVQLDVCAIVAGRAWSLAEQAVLDLAVLCELFVRGSRLRSES
jgi:hypothetical protein